MVHQDLFIINQFAELFTRFHLHKVFMLLFNINQFQGLVHIYQPISAFLARSPRSKTWFKSQNPRYPTSSYKFGGEHQIVPKRTNFEWRSERGACRTTHHTLRALIFMRAHLCAPVGRTAPKLNDARSENFSHTYTRLAHHAHIKHKIPRVCVL